MIVKIGSAKTDDAIVRAFRVRGSVRQAFTDVFTIVMAPEVTLPVRWEDRDFLSSKWFDNSLRIAYLRADLMSALAYASVARLSSVILGGCQGGFSPLVFIYPPDKNS